jgi:hypothetical protein
MWTKNSWGNQHFFKMLIKKCWSRKMLRRKNVGNIPKNVDEKMFWQRSWKMLTKNIGKNTKKCWQKIFANFRKNIEKKMLATLPKNIDKKMLVTLPKKYWWEKCRQLLKNVDQKKCWQQFWKMLTKNVGSTPKNVDEKMLTKNYSQHSEKCWWKNIGNS